MIQWTPITAIEFHSIIFNSYYAWIFVYVFTTEDIHGWQPGPIGQSGRIVVCTLGSWIFWAPVIWWLYLRNKKKIG